jgi:hypothetical protein
MSLACWVYFIDEQRPRTPLAMVANLPCYLTMPGGSMLLMCGFDLHLKQVKRCTVWMVKNPRHLEHHALSRALVLNDRFSFSLWYKQ